MDFIRRFENWAAPFVLIVAVFLFIWMASQAGGLGPIVEDPGTLGWGDKFWSVFFPSLMAMIAFWSTLSLNMPDFTRFGKSQRAQATGQILGLPTTMTVFPLLAVLMTSASQVVYGDRDLGPGRPDRQVRQPHRRGVRAVHPRGRDPLGQRRGERGQPVL